MNHTHRKLIALLLGAGLLGLSGMASAAMTGIVNSKHDLSSASTSGGNKVTGTAAAGTGTDETCVFCHTPHAAADKTVPLWNKQLTAAPTGGNLYSSTTMDGTADFGSAGSYSTSLACLSCHDGTQAMDNIVNAPGSGAGAGATNLGLAWTWSGTTVDGDGKLTGFAMLGTNLGDDHPVAIPYAGGGLDATPLVSEFADPDFNIPVYDGSKGDRWWFNTDTSGTAGKMDKGDVRLYTRNSTGMVECASCHDPHQGNMDAAAGPTTFLRVANTSSAVCVACHNK